MNKKGVGLGPAIVIAVILLAVFFVSISGSLIYGKGNAVRVAKINAERLEVSELLLDLLKVKVGELNVADLVVLGESSEVENVVKEKLAGINYNFRIYQDFKNAMQSKPIYALENIKDEDVVVVQIIKNYFGESLIVYLSVKNE